MENKISSKVFIDKPETPVIVESAKLFGKDRKIRILHEDKLYQLTITRQNKLILTK